MKNNPLVYLFIKTWQYSEGNRKWISFSWMLFVVGKSLDLFLNPLIWANILSVIQTQGFTESSIHTLTNLLLLLIAVEAVSWVFHGPARVIEQTNAFIVRRNYREYLLKGMMVLPMEWHVEHHTGDTIDKIEKGTTAIFGFAEDSFEFIYAIVQLVVSYGMLAYLSHSSAYIVLVMLFVSGWFTIQFDKVLIKNYRAISRTENGVSQSVIDAITNISTVIILRVEKLVFSAIMHKVDEPFGLHKRTNRIQELKWFITSMCCVVMVAIVLEAYFYQNIGSTASILTAYLIVQYLMRVSELFFRFNNMYGDIIKKKTRLMNAEEISEDFCAQNFTNHVLPSSWRELSISNLSFSYSTADADNLHLDNISLSIRNGGRIAFIGPSGGGKTTLLNVMRDLYSAKSMTLSVDGTIIPEGFAGISRAITLVPQMPEILSTTILENITMGAEYDMAFIQRFTEMACVADVIEGLPKKFDSLIKEKGVNLSGGQQQRLALARGLLACYDKDIVLLDEPTSSLDTATEMRVYQNIFQEFRGKTIIASVHRLHLLPLFDKIYLFEGGRISASGTLGEILMQSPQFAEMWNQYHQHQNMEAV